MNKLIISAMSILLLGNCYTNPIKQKKTDNPSISKFKKEEIEKAITINTTSSNETINLSNNEHVSLNISENDAIKIKDDNLLIGSKDKNIVLNITTGKDLVFKNIKPGTGVSLVLGKDGKVYQFACPRQYKENITTVSADTSKIYNINVKEFNFIGDSTKSWGVIGEDLLENNILTEVVQVYNNEVNYVAYDMITMAMLIELQKLHTQQLTDETTIETLQSTITTMQNTINSLDTRLNALEQ